MSALDLSSTFLQFILDSYPAICSVVDEKSNIIMVNNAWREFGLKYGASQDTINGVDLNYLNACRQLPDNPEQALVLRRIAHNLSLILQGQRDEYSIEYAVTPGADGQWYLLQIKGFDFDESRYAIISHTDISSQIALQNQLAESLEQQKKMNHLKSEFLTMVAHEVRTPLTVIMNQLYLLKTKNLQLKPAERLSRFELMNDRLHDLDKLLDELIELGKYELGNASVNYQVIYINQLVENIVESLRTVYDPQCNITIHLETEQAQITSDVTQVTKIITNLISNAIKYTPDHDGNIYITVSVTKGFLNLTIEDEGIGIPKADLSNLYDLFFRSDNAHSINGTGIGLRIVKQALDLLGGSIRLDSELGQGTTCTVMIPV